jgi:hypothetical protein
MLHPTRHDTSSQLCREQRGPEKPTIILLKKFNRLTNLLENVDFTWQKAG